MLIKSEDRSIPLPSEITPQSDYLSRREFISRALSLSALGMTASLANTGDAMAQCEQAVVPGLEANETPNKFEEITNYNNFYEYSTSKEAIAELATNLKTRPWVIRIEGEVEKPRVIDIEALMGHSATVERIYRLRCVEGWSMVIPWQGIPLCELLRSVQPTSNARYVEFETLFDPNIFYGQRRKTMDWPYREGLRIDEAMHPLTLLATGLYGQSMPNQNGAPIRLVVPWKYGFKSIKSIVRIRLSEQRPATAWSSLAPSEYGFYANVNPLVDHPRWSQRREVRIGELRKRPTLMFNGYAESVAGLYTGMDLSVNY